MAKIKKIYADENKEAFSASTLVYYEPDISRYSAPPSVYIMPLAMLNPGAWIP